jgi:broad specificity phosphatase PhoE
MSEGLAFPPLNDSPLTESGSSHRSEKPSNKRYEPIVHLMRHAQVCQPPLPLHLCNLLTIVYQSEHKPEGYESFSKEQDDARLEIEDPGLNKKGRSECLAFLNSFKEDAPHIAHIFTSPLTRCLVTVIGALRDVLERGIMVVPMAEIQTLGWGPNATGPELHHMFFAYDNKAILKPTGLEGKVDWRFMRTDWNEGKGPEEIDGIWDASMVDWRKNYVMGFLRGIIMAKQEEKVEILVVGHSSFFKKLLGINRDGMCLLTNLSPLILR